MSKSSIVFCVLFLACAAQGTNIIDSVISSITNIQNEVQSTVVATIATIETAAEEAVAQLNSLVTTVAQEADTTVNNLQTEVDSILSKVDLKVGTLISDITTTLSTSGCVHIVDTLTDTAVSLVAEATNCVAGKVEAAYGYIDEFTTEVQSLISKQHEIASASADCVSDVDTLTLAGRALVCTTDQWTSATHTAASSIATLTTSVARLTNLILTLQSDLTTCVVAETLDVLGTQADAIIEDVQDCVITLVS